MRFIANGPSIPDELLQARDQGRVVFFCGAGVSRAKANMPDFFGLAKGVSEHLNLSSKHPIHEVIEEAKNIGARTKIDGLISADKVFGLLEREFDETEIHKNVAKELIAPDGVDLSAHQILLRLSKTREGFIRLVTTNFDRLFNLCDEDINSFIPPYLPSIEKADEFDGVVYLHGRINEKGSGAENNQFVLSTSEFGRAYLSEAWATDFFKKILNKYFVVFIGYSADDPPVTYLLEALNKTKGPIEGIYAFQTGDEILANSKWQHKGVKAIPFHNYSTLWENLEAWACRADDPDSWIKDVSEMSKAGPENLRPHERGQVAHIVNTVEGVRVFKNQTEPPPATWLCVFDKNRRYAKPGRSRRYDKEGPYVDPFDLYGLDSDISPKKIDPQDYYEKREVPINSWDAFELNELDRANLERENIVSLKGSYSSRVPVLSNRLAELGSWIAEVSGQPECIWWAAHQDSMHPNVIEGIRWRLIGNRDQATETMKQAWKYLSEFWLDNANEGHQEWFNFKAEISDSTWLESHFRTFAYLSRPYINVKNNFWGGAVPEIPKDYTLSDLINIDVAYPEIPTQIDLPDQHLARLVMIIRKNLEIAVELEKEIGGFGLDKIRAINVDREAPGEPTPHDKDLSGWFLFYLVLFQRLVSLNINEAKSEMANWLADDVSIFARLRIWALGKSELIGDKAFNNSLKKISDEAFWRSDHSRDLLLSLSQRWNDLPDKNILEIEKRIKNGPKRWVKETSEDHKKRKAWHTLTWLHWLKNKGCELKLDLNEITDKLKKIVPDWREDYSENADADMGPRSGWVKQEKDFTDILNVPLSNILKEAKKISGRHRREFTNYDPFSGLSESKPIKAFAALRLEANNDRFPEWAWRTFLDTQIRIKDPPKLTIYIANRITECEIAQLQKIIRPLCSWLKTIGEKLATNDHETFFHIVSLFIDVLNLPETDSSSGISRMSADIDWNLEAINSPPGHLSEALLNDKRLKNLKTKGGFPKDWLEQVYSLISLNNDKGNYALAIFAYRLSWFFQVDPEWTENNMLSLLKEGADDQKEALWSGFLLSGQAAGQAFLDKVKPYMLKRVTEKKNLAQAQTETLAALTLTAWALIDDQQNNRWLTNNELTETILNADEDYRYYILSTAQNKLGESPSEWFPFVVDLLENVWPRQTSIKTARISAKLADMAFSSEEHFPALVKVILPLSAQADINYIILPHMRKSKDGIIEKFPEDTLSLLFKILPEDPKQWPYELDKILDGICDSDGNLKDDNRMIELKRRWDTR